ncbi:phage portal protein [Jeotgalibacillus malaysiensis]|uniref:XkdQ/YqbQ family protein n=1 Tax=Jeotgalibacillus malaysiensis TaxID=1508404 RepID=UPI00384CBBA7
MVQIPVESVTWSGQRFKAARKIDVRCLNRTVNEGETVILKWREVELFRGIVFKKGRSKDTTLTFTAYDLLQYLLKNRDVYIFSNKRADQILSRICNDFQIPVSSIANTGYVIKSLPFINETSLYDIWLKAMIETEKQTGIRYNLKSEKGKIKLEKVTSPSGLWVLETGNNIENYSYDTSIEDTATQVKVVSGTEENKQTVVISDNDGKQRFGTLQYYENVPEELNKAQLTERANNLLAEKKGIAENLIVDSLGIPSLTSGMMVQTKIDDLGINRQYYLDDDIHTFAGSSHTMNVKLIRKNVLPEVV